MGKSSEAIDRLVKEVPCINCLIYAICRNRFREVDRKNDDRGVVFSVEPVDELKIKCRLLHDWCENDELFLRNMAHYTVYYFYTGKRP